MFTSLILQSQKLDIKHICHHINKNLAVPSLSLTFLCMVQAAISSTDVENSKAVLYQLPVNNPWYQMFALAQPQVAQA